MTILHAERRIDGSLAAHSAPATGTFHSSTAKTHYAADLRLEPLHLEIALRLDIDARRAHARVTHRLRAGEPDVRSVTFDGIDLQELRVEGARHNYDGCRLTLAWDTPFEAGEERSVTLEYEVRDPKTGLLFSHPGPYEPDAPRFAVTDHETERARYWLPTLDAPAARPTVDLHLRADASLTLLGSGALVGEEVHEDGTKTAHWRLEQRCPSYLLCFAVGDFVRWDGGEVNGIPLAAFGPSGRCTPEHLERSFGRIREMIEWVPKRLGIPFPYPKYYQFAVPGIGGAMENISLTSWDDRFLLDESLEQEERQLLDAINLHELAHTWFGDHVVCRDYAHAWLKEGWATYMEACWLEHDLGRDARDYDLWVSARSYIRECTERYQRPIVTRRFDSSFDMYDMHLYPGAAWRIHMLRGQLGEEVFWRAVQSYLERYGDSVVETDDFRRVLEEASGRSLARYFDQWLHAPGYPKLKGRFRYDPERQTGTIELEQTQVDVDKGIPCFDLDVELRWRVESETQRSVLRFADGRRKASLEVPMSAAPSEVRIDPDVRILHDLEFDVGAPLLRAQLKASDVIGRIQAGRALCQSGTRENIEAVGKAFRVDPYWGVQVQWAEALGEAKVQAAADVLRELVSEHQEPRSMAALCKAAGAYRDPGLARALEERLRQGLTPRAAEAAAESLGAQRSDADRALLEQCARTPAFTGFAAAGALRGLGATRAPEAQTPLESTLREGAPRLRQAAALGLGALARGLRDRPRERALEVLVDTLRDSSATVRDAAALGLCRARAREALPALDAYMGTLPLQFRTRLERKVAPLRQSDGDLAKAEGRIEELEQRLRAVSERLERLEMRQDR